MCPFSPAPPSPTASLPQLSLSLLLDVIYSGNAESDKLRLPRRKQWQRTVQGRQPSLDNVLRSQRAGEAPGGAGGSPLPFLLVCSRPKILTWVSWDIQIPILTPTQPLGLFLSTQICLGKSGRAAQGSQSLKIRVVLLSHFLKPGPMVQKVARFPEMETGRKSALLGSQPPTLQAANTGTVRSCGRPKAQERAGSTHSCFHLAQKSSVGRSIFTPWVSDSLAGRNWALLPKINVPSPAPWLSAPAH